jgi:hypothetical protein
MASGKVRVCVDRPGVALKARRWRSVLRADDETCSAWPFLGYVRFAVPKERIAPPCAGSLQLGKRRDEVLAGPETSYWSTQIRTPGQDCTGARSGWSCGTRAARCTLLLSYGLQKFRDVWQRELRFSKCGAVIQT